MGFWCDDLVCFNGFNEVMIGWGCEDMELVVCVFYVGLQWCDVCFSVFVFYFYYWLCKNVGDNFNDCILVVICVVNMVWCILGIDQYFFEFLVLLQVIFF